MTFSRLIGSAVLAAVAVAALLWTSSRAVAAEVHTNARGGGPWSDPKSWHGGRLPGPGDDVVVAMRDQLVFDLKDVRAPSCRDIYIDPEGVLSFKTDRAEYVLTLAGSIHAYGTVKIDARNTPDARCELRFVPAPGTSAQIELLEHAALVLMGAAGAREAGPNISVTSVGPDGRPSPTPATVTANDKAVVIVDRARVEDVALKLSALDNTGAQPSERLSITESQFRGLARIELADCDTPSIRGNEFANTSNAKDFPAIRLSGCSLADCRGNRLTGPYTHALLYTNDTGSILANNTIEGSLAGVAWDGKNGVIRGHEIRNCSSGVVLGAGSATVEDVSVDGAKVAFEVAGSTGHQLTSCRASAVAKGGAALALDAASVTLLNSNIATDQIRLNRAPPDNLPFVQSMNYLVVKVEPKPSQAAWVEVRTAAVSGGVPAGKGDLNVRSSPAYFDPHGVTPLPRTTRSLVVRSWKIGPDKQRVNAPFYDLTVLSRGADAASGPKKLASQLVEPSETWFQADTSQPRPTLEVPIR